MVERNATIRMFMAGIIHDNVLIAIDDDISLRIRDKRERNLIHDAVNVLETICCEQFDPYLQDPKTSRQRIRLRIA